MPIRLRPVLIRSLLLSPLALLAGCGDEPAGRHGGNATAADNGAGDTAGEAANDAAPNAVAGGDEGVLIPPAPGEPGGLPDDRAPLDEAAARVPTSVAASGATIARWGLALAERRYGDAYRLWRDEGRQSGQSEARFAESWRGYAEIHVLIGRPEAGGTQTARVPVQVYGRLRENGRPFNLVGTMTLARNPAGQRGEAGQAPWLIAASALQPRGTVRVAPPRGEAMTARIPAAFQGNWSASTATCGKPGDDMRLTIAPDSLIFYESVGRVTAMDRPSPAAIRLSVDYEGEGESWSKSATLTLSDSGKALTIDGVKRVRCG